MISRKFIKSSLIYTLAGSLPMASAVILLPFYMHYLPTEVYGRLAIYLAFSMLLQILITYSLDTSVYIYFHEFKKEPGKLASFVSSAFVFMLVAGVVVGMITFFAGSFVFDRIFHDQGISFYPYGLMSLVTAMFQSIFKVYSSLLQSREKPVVYFWSNVSSFSLIALFTILGLWFFPATLAGPIGGRMIAVIFSAIWALSGIFREFGFHFNYPLLRSSFEYNRSAFIYQLQLWTMNSLDRMILVFFVTMSDIGVYDFAMKCMLVIDFIIGGLYNSFYPRVLGEIMGQEKKQTTIEINRYYHGLTAVVMLLVCLSLPVFMILSDTGLIRSGYEESVRYIPLIGIIYLIRSMRYYFAMPYGALKYSKPLPWMYLALSVCKVGLLVALGKSLGVYAVIISAMVSGILEVILLKIFVSGKFTFKMNMVKLIGAPIVLASVFMAITFTAIGSTYMVQGAILGFCIVLLWWLYRNELKQIKFSKYFKSEQR